MPLRRSHILSVVFLLLALSYSSYLLWLVIGIANEQSVPAEANGNNIVTLKHESNVAAESAFDEGGLLSANGDFDKAIDKYSEAIELDPNFVSAYCSRGVAWARKGDQDNAIKDYNEAIQLDPNFVSAYYSRGAAWANKGDHDNAIKDYTKAIRVDPGNAGAFAVRGINWARKRNYENAFKDINEAIRLNSTLAHDMVARILSWPEKGDYEKEFKCYTEAIRIVKDNAEAIRSYPVKPHPIYAAPVMAAAYNKLAWLQSTCPIAEYRDGRKAIENAFKACEHSNWIWDSCKTTLAAAYAEAGEFDKAIARVEKSIEENSNGQEDLRRDMLEHFKQGKPYHELSR